MKYSTPSCWTRFLPALVAMLLLLVASSGVYVSAQTNQTRTPTETVREFYKMMRERKFREAFALSIYRPAIEPLSAEELEELRPDLERMAAVIPEKIEVSGQQISGDISTVFVKIAGTGAAAEPEAEPVTLVRDRGVWIVGDKVNMEVVRKAGKQFFFEARIQTHHNEVQEVLRRISLAQLAYSTQHKNLFADLSTLIKEGLVPKDIEAPDTTGYVFRVTLSKNGKSWSAGAEPLRYNRTGRLSYYLNEKGIYSADTGGKPLIPPTEKQ